MRELPHSIDAHIPWPPQPIRTGQAGSVYALIDRCYREFGLVLRLDDPCEAHLADPGGYFRAAGGEFWVLCGESGAAQATCALWLDRTVSPVRAELKSMYVDPIWRRRGLGRRLTQWVIDAARAVGAHELELWSDTRFTPAHAMYESLGFVREGVREIDDSNDSREFCFRRFA